MVDGERKVMEEEIRFFRDHDAKRNTFTTVSILLSVTI